MGSAETLTHREMLCLVAERGVWAHLHLHGGHKLQIPDHASLWPMAAHGCQLSFGTVHRVERQPLRDQLGGWVAHVRPIHRVVTCLQSAGVCVATPTPDHTPLPCCHRHTLECFFHFVSLTEESPRDWWKSLK